MTLSARITRLRTRRGLSQSELGRRAGLSRSTISRLEAGVRVPSMAALAAIAKALRCRVASLLGDG
jgi:transcriptional regulator with XRE-family HTH domain